MKASEFKFGDRVLVPAMFDGEGDAVVRLVVSDGHGTDLNLVQPVELYPQDLLTALKKAEAHAADLRAELTAWQKRALEAEGELDTQNLLRVLKEGL